MNTCSIINYKHTLGAIWVNNVDSNTLKRISSWPLYEKMYATN